MPLNRCRTSANTSARLRSFNTNGTSISEVSVPRACSSNSARPLLRDTTTTSGTFINSASASSAIRTLSSSEVPGIAEIEIAIDPSLNGGRKFRPKVAKIPPAPTNSTTATTTTAQRCRSAPPNSPTYPAFIRRTIHGSRSCRPSIRSPVSR